MAPKCVSGWGIGLDPTGGGYSASQSLALFRGRFAAREGRGGKGKGKGKQSKSDGSITSRFTV